MIRSRRNASVSLGVSLLTAVLLPACAPKQNQALLDITAVTDRFESADAYQKVTGVLIDKNFDIKQGDKDLGLVTTEYKQFASVNGDPPFDFYLQIRTTIKDRDDGKLVIKMTPAVKEQNRLNAAAFTERHLVFFDPEAQDKAKWDKTAEARVKGQLMFMNVVQSVAEACGLGIEELEQNVQLQ